MAGQFEEVLKNEEPLDRYEQVAMMDGLNNKNGEQN